MRIYSVRPWDHGHESLGPPSRMLGTKDAETGDHGHDDLGRTTHSFGTTITRIWYEGHTTFPAKVTTNSAVVSQNPSLINSRVVLLCLSLCLIQRFENVLQPHVLFPEGHGNARLPSDELHPGADGCAAANLRSPLVERFANDRL